MRRHRQTHYIQRHGLSDHDLSRLAAYNAERARGIVHTPEWQAEMAQLQATFDANTRRAAEADPNTILVG